MVASVDDPYLGLDEAAAGLRGGTFSSQELTQAALDRLAATGDSLRAFITVTAEKALADAAE